MPSVHPMRMYHNASLIRNDAMLPVREPKNGIFGSMTCISPSPRRTVVDSGVRSGYSASTANNAIQTMSCGRTICQKRLRCSTLPSYRLS